MSNSDATWEVWCPDRPSDHRITTEVFMYEWNSWEAEAHYGTWIYVASGDSEFEAVKGVANRIYPDARVSMRKVK